MAVDERDGDAQAGTQAARAIDVVRTEGEVRLELDGIQGRLLVRVALLDDDALLGAGRGGEVGRWRESTGEADASDG